jgi:hypothetical protein
MGRNGNRLPLQESKNPAISPEILELSADSDELRDHLRVKACFFSRLETPAPGEPVKSFLAGFRAGKNTAYLSDPASLQSSTGPSFRSFNPLSILVLSPTAMTSMFSG